MTKMSRICGLCLVALIVGLSLRVSAAVAAFGIASVSTEATNENGTLDLQAGSHPFSYTFEFALNRDSEGLPEGQLGGVEVDLPAGLIGDPGAVPTCSRAEFDGASECSSTTQVGIVEGTVAGFGIVSLPLYNLAPPPGVVASFGGSVEGRRFIELLELAGSGPSAHLRVTVSAIPESIVEVAQAIWGVPADPGHDPERGGCLSEGGRCPATVEPSALLTLPTRCGESPVTTVAVSSIEEPARALAATAEFLDQGGSPHELIGCDALPFFPVTSLGLKDEARSSSGLRLDLRLRLSEQPYGSAAAAVRELTLDLPSGLAINPSAASGLEACSPAQIGLQSEPGQAAFFDSAAPMCPGGSKVGTVSAELPALGETLSGSVYLATPGQNPYATTFAVYMVLENPSRGLEIKIPGRIEADPETGRLTVMVTDLPEFPFADFVLEFPSGPRALFATPESCGAYSATAEVTPSTAPEAPAVSSVARFTISSGAGGGCPAPESARPATPSSFEAGTTLPIAGSPSSFLLRLTRGDLDQRFGSFDLTLPPGLNADLGSTPLGTAVGTVQVQAGLGSQPLTLDGTAYLAGPYRGFPYSLDFVVPAQAGPFDLGTIVERAALEVNPETAQISLRSDPLPQILSGVPLEVRSLTVDLNRAGFIRNPTSCEPMAITGSSTTAVGQSAPLSARFQVGACAALSFKPKISLRLSGAPGRGGHPGVRAVMSDGEGEATPASAGFTLPAGELLDLKRIRALCPRGVPADRCPSGSRLGSVSLGSSFLPEPLTGSLYLRVPSHRLPDLAAALHSPSGSLEFALRGHTTDAHGRIGIKLESLPDVPLSSAIVNLAGGRDGIFVNSRALCGHRSQADASLSAHNGMQRQVRVPVRVDGCR
jgi:hypothetical protein